MKQETNIFFLFLLFITQLVSGQGQDVKLDRYFKKKTEKARIVGMQLGYIKSDGTIWKGSYGKQDYRIGLSINDSTLFMIASCSKPVTALAILKLFNKFISIYGKDPK